MDFKSRPISRPFTIIVEGNIGSGKSTFLGHFTRTVESLHRASKEAGVENIGSGDVTASSPAVEVLPEPVDKWRDVNGHNLLHLMYKEPGRWSLAFQSYVQLTMVKLHLLKTQSPIKVMERSLHSGRHCFIENLYRSGKLPGSEYNVLNEWYNFLTSDLGCTSKFDLGVDLIVYLRTSPSVALERIRQRARTEEDLIPIEYLQELHDLHEEWLMGTKSSASLPARVLVLDANEDIYKNPELFTDHCANIFHQCNLGNSPGKQQDPAKNVTPSSKTAPKALGEVNR